MRRCSGIESSDVKFLPEIPFPPGTKERKKALGRRHYLMHREKMLERQKQYRIENSETWKQKSRNHHASVKGRARSLFNAARRRSTDRNYEFTIDLEWIETRISAGKCEITGLPFSLETRVSGHRNPYAPSLDRRDNSKGYTKENCRIILWALNMGFADWGQETYIKIARRLIEFGDL